MFSFITAAVAGWWWRTPLIPALGRRRQVDLREFEAWLPDAHLSGFLCESSSSQQDTLCCCASARLRALQALGLLHIISEWAKASFLSAHTLETLGWLLNELGPPPRV